MIIGVTGYGCTGASGYIDLIKEFDGVQSFSGNIEFQLLQQPDGINDLRYFLVDARRRLGMNAAINRFYKLLDGKGVYNLNKVTNGHFDELSRKYIKDLIQVQWNGRSNYDPVDLSSFFDSKMFKPFNRRINNALRKVNKNFHWPPYRNRYFSMLSDKDFVARTTAYLEDVLLACGFDESKPIILEQLFSCINPLAGADCFLDVRSLVVDRDPRDVYLMTNYLVASSSAFLPNSGNVDDFITYYKMLHKDLSEDSRVKYLKFEDLIYRYDETVGLIREWMGVEHIHPKEYFKPEYSIVNTMLFKKYPEHEKEFKRIEEELPEYLYPFEDVLGNINFTPKDVKPFIFQAEVDGK